MQQQSKIELWKSIAPAFLTLLAVVIIWESLKSNMFGGINLYPSAILEASVRNRALILKHAIPTFSHTIIGFCISAVVGTGLALAFNEIKLIRRIFYPVVFIAQIVPKEALVPLLVLWFGTGDLPRIILAFLIAFFSVLVNSLAGLDAIPRELNRLHELYHTSKYRQITKVSLPYAMPHIFNGLKVAITLAVTGVIVAEILAGKQGLGYLILFTASRQDFNSSFAIFIALSIIGLGLYGILNIIQSKFFWWST